MPGGVPTVGEARGESQHARAAAGQHDRWAAWSRSARNHLAITRGVVPSLEIDASGAQQGTDDLQTFLEAASAVVEWHSEGIELRLAPASAEPRQQPTPAAFVERGTRFAQPAH